VDILDIFDGYVGYLWICMDIKDGYLIQYNKSDMFLLRPVYIHGYPYISIDIHRYPTYQQGPSSQMGLRLPGSGLALADGCPVAPPRFGLSINPFNPKSVCRCISIAILLRIPVI
jgi:hypothetical protein